MNFLPEGIHYRIEVMRVGILRWYYQSRFHDAMSKDMINPDHFNLDSFYSEITTSELHQIIWYNFSGNNKTGFVIIGDELYGDMRPFSMKEIDDIGKAMWIMIVNPRGTSHLLIPTLQRRVSFDGVGRYQEGKLTVTDEYGIDPEIIQRIGVSRLSAANRVYTSTVETHKLLRLVQKRK